MDLSINEFHKNITNIVIIFKNKKGPLKKEDQKNIELVWLV